MVYCNWFATSEYGLVTPFLCYFWNLRKSLYKILATISCKCNQIKDVIMVFEKAFIFIAFKYCNFFYLGIAMFLPLIVLLVYVHCVAYLCAVVFSGLKTWVIIKIFTHPCYSRHFDWFSWGWTKIQQTIFLGMKQKKIGRKKIEMADSKNWVFQICQFSIFLAKISQIGPWNWVCM